MSYNEISIYRGKDIAINKNIIITQPTIGQIEEFGERDYFGAIHLLTSVGADLKWQLWDYYNLDYTKVKDYDLFVNFIYKLITNKQFLYKVYLESPESLSKETRYDIENNIDSFKKNPLELILKNINLCDFSPMLLKDSEKTDEIILYNQKEDITIDRIIYTKMVEAIRKIHNLKRNNELPGNETTKRDMIDDARDEALLNKNKPYVSMLLPLVSTLDVLFLGNTNIWDMKIARFFNIIKRINKIEDAKTLLSASYSGFANLKGINHNRFNMFGDFEK